MKTIKTISMLLCINSATYVLASPFSSLLDNANVEFSAPKVSCLSIRCFDGENTSLENFLNASISSSGARAQGALGIQGGSFSYRNNPPPIVSASASARIRPPTAEVGCNGIDMNFGSFQFAFDFNFSVESYKGIIQGAGMYFVRIAMASISPLIDGVASSIENFLNQLSQFEIDSCKMGEGIAVWTHEQAASIWEGRKAEAAVEEAGAFNQRSEYTGAIQGRSSAGLTSAAFIEDQDEGLQDELNEAANRIKRYQYLNTTALAIYGTEHDHERRTTIPTLGLLGFQNDPVRDYRLFHDFMWRIPYALVYRSKDVSCDDLTGSDKDTCEANTQAGKPSYGSTTLTPVVNIELLINGFDPRRPEFHKRPVDIDIANGVWNVGIYSDDQDPGRLVTNPSNNSDLSEFPGYRQMLSNRLANSSDPENNLMFKIHKGTLNISELNDQEKLLLSILGTSAQDLILIATVEPENAAKLVQRNIGILAHQFAVEDIVAHGTTLVRLLTAHKDRIPDGLALHQQELDNIIKEINEYITTVRIIESPDIQAQLDSFRADLDREHTRVRNLLPSIQMTN